MLFLPWLIFSRKRLILAAAISVLLACLMHMWVSADCLTDLGIFWHHSCGCPVDPDDAYLMLSWPGLTAGIVAIVVGAMPLNHGGASTVPGGWLKAYRRFVLTRPRSRISQFVAPHLLATLAIAILPAAALALLLGWLQLVHAPSLHHLWATMRVIPRLSQLPPHPSLMQVLLALDAPRRYLAAISTGLCMYALFAAQPFLLIAENNWLKVLGALPVVIFLFPIMSLLSRNVRSLLLLSASRGTSLEFVPSTAAIVLHFAFAAGIFYGCWRIVRGIEL